MITSVHYQPHFYSTAYNPIVWSFSSDKASELNFSYVVDVYVNAATGATAGYYRIKQKPNQLGACMVDVSSIVQGYVDLTLYSAEEGWPVFYRNTAEIAPSVWIKVGEEYGYPQSNLVIYNGYGATGAPAYPIYSLDAPGYPVVALPGALPYQDAIDSMAATGGYGFYTDYIPGTGGTGTTRNSISGVTGDGLYLTQWPFTDIGPTGGPFSSRLPGLRINREIPISLQDHHTLSFLNWNPDPQVPTIRKSIYALGVFAYGGTGYRKFPYNTAGMVIPNQQNFGGGPNVGLTGNTSATGASGWAQPYTMITASVGPKDFGLGCVPWIFINRSPSPQVYEYTTCWGATGATVFIPGGSGSRVEICGRDCGGLIAPSGSGYPVRISGTGPVFQSPQLYSCVGVTGSGCWDLVDYYEVEAIAQGVDPISGNITGIAPALEIIRFNITENCQDLYPAVRLSWLNELGGRDYYTFDMFYEKVSTSTGLEYQQVPLNWNAYTPVVTTGNPNANTAPNWQRGGGKSFNKVTGRRFSIQSDWLTQQYVDYLAGIAQSPSVWAYVGDEPIPYTVVVTNTEYTYKTVKQTKMVQVTFDCQLTKVQPRQNY